MKTLEVNVTAEDIAGGKRCSNQCCPIALALSRVLGANDVCVGAWSAMSPSANFCERLPDVVQQFIKAYDRGESVEPMSFVVEIERY